MTEIMPVPRNSHITVLRPPSICFGLVKNHPFLDGNKRIGVHIALVFLALNGVELQYSQVELSDVILRLAAGEVEAGDLLHWILEHQGSR